MLGSLMLAGCGNAVAQDPAGFNPRRQALLNAAHRPAPHELQPATHQPRHPVYTLPFAPKSVPGFSPDTHDVHYIHHYLEYHRRWELGERRVLRLAAEANDDAAMSILAEQHEQMRQAAALVILHEIYWDAFGTAARKDCRVPNALLGAATGEWLLLMEDRLTGERYIRPLESQQTYWNTQHRVVEAIDLMEHAWLIDFRSVEDYLKGLFCIMTDKARANWLSATEVRIAKIPAIAGPSPTAISEVLQKINADHEEPLSRAQVVAAAANLQALAHGGRLAVGWTTSPAVPDFAIWGAAMGGLPNFSSGLA